MTAPTVALCMIVRNEEGHLQACLDSVEDLCVERIVVDTGSTDATVAIAERARARVIHFPWCDDFAAARNAGLREATSDWVLILDADERLTAGSVERIRQQLQGITEDCGMIRLHDASTLEARAGDVVSGLARLGEPMYVARLLRRTADLEFEGIVHESVRRWLVRNGNRAFNVGAEIVHYGAVASVRMTKAKSDRNLRLLEKRLELEPDNFTVHGYLAHEYAEIKATEKARETAEEGWRILKTATRTTLRSAIRLMTARCVQQLQQGDLAGVLASVDDAIAYEGESPDALFFRGRAFEHRALSAGAERDGDLASAEEAYRSCLEFADKTFAQRFVRGASTWCGRLRLGTVRLLQGNAEDALRLFEESHAEEPSFGESLYGACEALVDLGRAEEALARLEPCLATSLQPDGWLVAAEAAHDLGNIGDMKLFLGRARSTAPAGYLAAHRNAIHSVLHCELTAYLGRPQSGPGAIGTACGLMSGAAAEGRIARGERRPLVRFLRGMLVANQASFVERLLAPDAERALPGILGLVQEAVESLEMAPEERG